MSLLPRINAVMADVRSELPPLPTDTVETLVRVGELRIGMEILLDNISHHPKRLRPSARLRAELLELATEVGVDPAYSSGLPVAGGD